jgi:hypothetical protein
MRFYVVCQFTKPLYPCIYNGWRFPVYIFRERLDKAVWKRRVYTIEFTTPSGLVAKSYKSPKQAGWDLIRMATRLSDIHVLPDLDKVF